jgi:hypothetical protein
VATCTAFTGGASPRLLKRLLHARARGRVDDFAKRAQGEEEILMLPFLNPNNADLFFQTIMALAAGFTVVFTSLATWLRC